MPELVVVKRFGMVEEGEEVEGKEAEKRVKKRKMGERERERYDKNEKEKGDARIYLDGRNGLLWSS